MGMAAPGLWTSRATAGRPGLQRRGEYSAPSAQRAVGDPQRTPGGWLKRETNTQNKKNRAGEGRSDQSGANGMSGRGLASVPLGPLCLFSPVPVSHENTFVVSAPCCPVSRASQCTFSAVRAS